MDQGRAVSIYCSVSHPPLFSLQPLPWSNSKSVAICKHEVTLNNFFLTPLDLRCMFSSMLISGIYTCCPSCAQGPHFSRNTVALSLQPTHPTLFKTSSHPSSYLPYMAYFFFTAQTPVVTSSADLFISDFHPSVSSMMVVSCRAAIASQAKSLACAVCDCDITSILLLSLVLCAFSLTHI